MSVQTAFVLLAETVEEVAYAQPVARNLVGVRGADALAGGADFRCALGLLVGGVEQPVGGEDEVGFLGDFQYLVQVDAVVLNLFCFLHEEHGVEHHAAADDVGAAQENARRDGAEHDLLVVELEGVPGVGAALEASHGVVARCQHVNYLSFALVAPLEAE